MATSPEKSPEGEQSGEGQQGPSTAAASGKDSPGASLGRQGDGSHEPVASTAEAQGGSPQEGRNRGGPGDGGDKREPKATGTQEQERAEPGTTASGGAGEGGGTDAAVAGVARADAGAARGAGEAGTSGAGDAGTAPRGEDGTKEAEANGAGEARAVPPQADGGVQSHSGGDEGTAGTGRRGAEAGPPAASPAAGASEQATRMVPHASDGTRASPDMQTVPANAAAWLVEGGIGPSMAGPPASVPGSATIVVSALREHGAARPSGPSSMALSSLVRLLATGSAEPAPATAPAAAPLKIDLTERLKEAAQGRGASASAGKARMGNPGAPGAGQEAGKGGRAGGKSQSAVWLRPPAAMAGTQEMAVVALAAVPRRRALKAALAAEPTLRGAPGVAQAPGAAPNGGLEEQQQGQDNSNPLGKRKRGRPKKVRPAGEEPQEGKRKRGRPKKQHPSNEMQQGEAAPPKQPAGKPSEQTNQSTGNAAGPTSQPGVALGLPNEQVGLLPIQAPPIRNPQVLALAATAPAPAAPVAGLPATASAPAMAPAALGLTAPASTRSTLAPVPSLPAPPTAVAASAPMVPAPLTPAPVPALLAALLQENGAFLPPPNSAGEAPLPPADPTLLHALRTQLEGAMLRGGLGNPGFGTGSAGGHVGVPAVSRQNPQPPADALAAMELSATVAALLHGGASGVGAANQSPATPLAVKIPKFMSVTFVPKQTAGMDDHRYCDVQDGAVGALRMLRPHLCSACQVVLKYGADFSHAGAAGSKKEGEGGRSAKGYSLGDVVQGQPGGVLVKAPEHWKNRADRTWAQEKTGLPGFPPRRRLVFVKWSSFVAAGNPAADIAIHIEDTETIKDLASRLKQAKEFGRAQTSVAAALKAKVAQLEEGTAALKAALRQLRAQNVQLRKDTEQARAKDEAQAGAARRTREKPDMLAALRRLKAQRPSQGGAQGLSANDVIGLEFLSDSDGEDLGPDESGEVEAGAPAAAEPSEAELDRLLEEGGGPDADSLQVLPIPPVVAETSEHEPVNELLNDIEEMRYIPVPVPMPMPGSTSASAAPGPVQAAISTGTAHAPPAASAMHAAAGAPATAAQAPAATGVEAMPAAPPPAPPAAATPAVRPAPPAWHAATLIPPAASAPPFVGPPAFLSNPAMYPALMALRQAVQRGGIPMPAPMAIPFPAVPAPVGPPSLGVGGGAGPMGAGASLGPSAAGFAAGPPGAEGGLPAASDEAAPAGGRGRGRGRRGRGGRGNWGGRRPGSGAKKRARSPKEKGPWGGARPNSGAKKKALDGEGGVGESQEDVFDRLGLRVEGREKEILFWFSGKSKNRKKAKRAGLAMAPVAAEPVSPHVMSQGGGDTGEEEEDEEEEDELFEMLREHRQKLQQQGAREAGSGGPAESAPALMAHVPPRKVQARPRKGLFGGHSDSESEEGEEPEEDGEQVELEVILPANPSAVPTGAPQADEPLPGEFAGVESSAGAVGYASGVPLPTSQHRQSPAHGVDGYAAAAVQPLEHERLEQGSLEGGSQARWAQEPEQQAGSSAFAPAQQHQTRTQEKQPYSHNWQL